MRNHAYILLNLTLLLVGVIVPFTPLCILEVFFLLIPMKLYALIFIFLLLFGLIRFNKSIIVSSVRFLLPLVIFVSSQILSCFFVEKYQKFQCNKLIVKLEKYKQINNIYPESLNNDMTLKGINYRSLENGYELSFGRGFLVSEVYNSTQKIWESYGWND